MAVVIVTGSCGLVGSEAVRFYHAKGFDVVGVDNDMRAYFFGGEASTRWVRDRLVRDLKCYTHVDADIRDEGAMHGMLAKHAGHIALIIHTAAQPSHDWAAKEPLTDFSVNATGTLTLLEATRQFCPDAPFIFTSTNKVYGDSPNALPLVEHESRWELNKAHKFAEKGITE